MLQLGGPDPWDKQGGPARVGACKLNELNHLHIALELNIH